MTKTAADIRMGESGLIFQLKGDPKLLRRLIDLGITEGASITIKKAAPFGGPLEIEVRGSRIGIRREQAEGIVLRSESRGEKLAAESKKNADLGIDGKP